MRGESTSRWSSLAAYTIDVPSQEQVLAAAREDARKFVDGKGIAPEEARLLADIEKTASARSMNALGKIYGRIGELDKAEELFKRALAPGPHFPALVNLGSVYYVRGDWSNALHFYEAAYALEPASSFVLLRLSQVNRSLERPEVARTYDDLLKSLDPAFAALHEGSAYGSGSPGRASEAAPEETQWEDSN